MVFTSGVLAEGGGGAWPLQRRVLGAQTRKKGRQMHEMEQEH